MVVLRTQCLVITDLGSNHRSITYWLWHLREVISSLSALFFLIYEDIFPYVEEFS